MMSVTSAYGTLLPILTRKRGLLSDRDVTSRDLPSMPKFDPELTHSLLAQLQPSQSQFCQVLRRTVSQLDRYFRTSKGRQRVKHDRGAHRRFRTRKAGGMRGACRRLVTDDSGRESVR